MGSKNKAGRETKKPKKDGKKTITSSTFEPQSEVELIKKKKKEEFPE